MVRARTVSRTFLYITLAVCLLLLMNGGADSYFVEIEWQVFSECMGEFVYITGKIHVLDHWRTDKEGCLRLSTHANYSSVSGVGLHSGIKYKATGSCNNHHLFCEGTPHDWLSVYHIDLIGSVSGNKLGVYYKFHRTVDTNGETTSYLSFSKSQCQ